MEAGVVVVAEVGRVLALLGDFLRGRDEGGLMPSGTILVLLALTSLREMGERGARLVEPDLSGLEG